MSESILDRPLSDKFHEAARYASALHASQARKGGQVPYVAHLFAVCSIVLENGGDEDEAIAALLHDGPEDQGGIAVLEEIGKRFGPRVKAIVEACSDSLVDTAGGNVRKEAWATRKARYIAHLRERADASTALVSASDKLHNARTTLGDIHAGRDVWSFFSAPREKVIGYYESLVDAYDAAPPDPRRTPIVEELRAIVASFHDARPAEARTA